MRKKNYQIAHIGDTAIKKNVYKRNIKNILITKHKNAIIIKVMGKYYRNNLISKLYKI
jgi:hypothetical protein